LSLSWYLIFSLDIHKQEIRLLLKITFIWFIFQKTDKEKINDENWKGKRKDDGSENQNHHFPMKKMIEVHNNGSLIPKYYF
jgi:hypothetical protein